jgi:GWxTD domain-containing protein
MRTSALLILLLILLLPASTVWSQEDQSSDALLREEMEDYFEKWLKQDVLWIITPEEKEIFQNLTTDEEKEQFIEQFWHRRDPDLTTSNNEFKEEHYRRIAYTVERFSSGAPGWKTDRGRIYIMHGPPDHIDPHPSGGTYERSIYEGGGFTATYPFEVWRYRYIEGVGSDIELEFVDPSWSGEYRLAADPDEKDSFAHVPTLGETQVELDGLMSYADRGTERDVRYFRRQDQPFQRYARYFDVQRTPQIKYKDLQEIVEIELSYETLPFQARLDTFWLNEAQVLVPITVEVQNKDLTFEEENGKRVAKVAVYGIVTSITNRVITEFDDDMLNSFTPEEFPRMLQGRSIYQKIIPLERKMRYKVDLVVKDLASGNLSVIRKAIVPPKYSEDRLVVSSVFLSDYIRQLDDVPSREQMFVLGDVWIRPSISNRFAKQNAFGVYFQLYNVALDQANFEPQLDVTYQIFKGEESVFELTQKEGESIQFFSGQRVVLIQGLPIRNLEPGRYTLRVKADDRINDQAVTFSEKFEVSSG